MLDLALGLAVGPLPSNGGLVALHALGFNDVINVSGAPSTDLWPAAVTLTMRLLDFRFRDAFAAADGLSPPPLDAREFGAFRDAVDAATDVLLAGRRCGVFCHRGVGRSPLVAAAALIRARGYPREQAMEAIRRLRPEASFTPASLAALDRLDAQPHDLGTRP